MVSGMSTCPIPCRESFVWLLLVLVPNIANARTVIRDCPHCAEIVLIPAGHFTMDSLGWEKSWAAHHGGSAGAVADEAPQHEVSVPSFALGRYPAWLLRSATHERNPDKERLHMLSSRVFARNVL
jgi:hypothetical protein